MNCHDVQSQLSAWLDGEVTIEAAKDIAAHIDTCAECQVQLAALQTLDAGLTSSFAEHADAADHVAERVIAALGSSSDSRGSLRDPTSWFAEHQQSIEKGERWIAERSTTIDDPDRLLAGSSNNSPPPAPNSGGSSSQSLKLFAAAAAGFVLAWFIFAPKQQEVAQNDRQPVRWNVARTGQLPPDPNLARLTVSTGDVEVRTPGQNNWLPTSVINPFRCPSGTEVRTGAGVRCELETDDLCTVRLNESTELAVRSPRQIELRSGQVWFSSSSDVALQFVSASLRTGNDQPAASPWSCVCPSNSTFMSEVDPTGGYRIVTADGEVDVSLGTERLKLKRGEAARIVEGKLVIEPHHADSLLVTSWMQPLLVRKGHDSPELGDRVNRLLANLGASKMTNLYEDEIRSLGDYAVLPLLRFVQSDSSRNDRHRRFTAMSIISDVAPTWVIEELIGLLSDDEPHVRMKAAAALLRLTGHDQNRPPANWSAPRAECEESLELWQIWWKANSHRFEPRQKRQPQPSNPQT